MNKPNDLGTDPIPRQLLRLGKKNTISSILTTVIFLTVIRRHLAQREQTA